MTKVQWPLMSLSTHGKSRVIWDTKQKEPIASGGIRGTENRIERIAENGDVRFTELQGYLCIYQERPTIHGRIYVREKYYVPTESEARVTDPNRTRFAEAVAAWQTLSMSDQIWWNKQKNPPEMSGYNRFLRAYLLPE